jgi:hypothetical protein
MSRDEQERLRDIADAITAIHRHLEQAGETTSAKEDCYCTTPCSSSSL